MMTKRFTMVTMGLLMGAGGVAGCGSDPAPQLSPKCGKDGFICETSGLPFVKIVAAVSDYCGGLVADCALPLPAPAGATTANLTKQGGQVCLSGFLATGGWTSIVMPFSEISADATMIVKSFDASALGITQVEFTIDSPLTGGVTAGATTTPPAPVECPDASCFTGFTFGTAPTGSDAEFTAPGSQVAPFANLHYTYGPGSSSFDPVALENITFSPAGSGDYAFCISDIRFRDAAGNEVKP